MCQQTCDTGITLLFVSRGSRDCALLLPLNPNERKHVTLLTPGAVLGYLSLFEASPQRQVPGSEGRQSSRRRWRGQSPDPARECFPQPSRAARGGEAGNTCCIPGVAHVVIPAVRPLSI